MRYNFYGINNFPLEFCLIRAVSVILCPTPFMSNNQNKIKPIGNFVQKSKINDDEYILILHVVPSDSIDVDVILGNE